MPLSFEVHCTLRQFTSQVCTAATMNTNQVQSFELQIKKQLFTRTFQQTCAEVGVPLDTVALKLFGGAINALCPRAIGLYDASVATIAENFENERMIVSCKRQSH
jgi:hypothetical protein